MNIRRPLIKLSALVVLIELLSSARPAAGATTNVFFNDFSYNPKVVVVNVGDTVTWVNQGGVHTATGTGADPICGGGTIPTSASRTFTTAGSFSYACFVGSHAALGMTGLVVVAAANMAPSVSIISPVSGAKVLAGSSPTIQASASDSDGSVARVDFYAGESAGSLGTQIGTTTSLPFQLVSVVPAGTFFLRAVATDNQGATNTSAVVQILSLTNATLVAGSPLAGAAVFTVSNSFVGQEYFVDALTNFTGPLSTRWFPIATNTAPSNNFIFTDGVLTNQLPRLYRVRQSL